MTCPACGKETSASRQSCEHCGAPLSAAPGANGKKKLPLAGILALALLAAAIVLSLFLFPGKKSAPEEPVELTAAAAEPAAAEPPSASPSPTAPTPKPAMSYAEFAAAPSGSPVVVETFVQDRQEWWNGKVAVYAQDPDGGYFLYDMACPEEDLARLVPGQKIRVSGVKSVYWDSEEILDASFEFVDAPPWIAQPLDLTDLLDRPELILYQNRLVLFREMTVEPYDESGAAFAYQDPDSRSDDLYFRVSRGDDAALRPDRFENDVLRKHDIGILAVRAEIRQSAVLPDSRQLTPIIR